MGGAAVLGLVVWLASALRRQREGSPASGNRDACYGEQTLVGSAPSRGDCRRHGRDNGNFPTCRDDSLRTPAAPAPHLGADPDSLRSCAAPGISRPGARCAAAPHPNYGAPAAAPHPAGKPKNGQTIVRDVPF